VNFGDYPVENFEWLWTAVENLPQISWLASRCTFAGPDERSGSLAGKLNLPLILICFLGKAVLDRRARMWQPHKLPVSQTWREQKKGISKWHGTISGQDLPQV
jgi:hypothetical protein